MAKAKEIVKDKKAWEKVQDKNLEAGSMIDAPIPKPSKQNGFPGSSEIEVNTSQADQFLKDDGSKVVDKRNASYIKEQTAKRERIRGKKPQ